MSPCNCGKNKKVRPFGPSKIEEEKVPTVRVRAGSDPKGTSKSSSFVLNLGAGRTLQFGSRLEAEAAKRRAGGGSISEG